MGAPQHSISSKLKSSMQLLFSLMLPLLALAQQDPNQPNNNNDMLGDGRSINLTWQRIVAGLVLLLVGVILTFRGYRVIIYSILTNVEPAQGWDRRQIIYVFSCIGGGLVLGFICWLLHRFTIWILGGVTGLAIALYILAWRDEGLIRSKGGRIGLLVGASVVGLLIALFLGRRILIPATAIVGAYITIIGIDLFARTGFSESIKRFFTTDSSVNYRLTTNLYIMLGCVAGLILLGLIFQTLSWRHRQRALIAQGRTVHDYDNDWSLFGRRRNRTVRPDPTYPNGHYDNTYDNRRYMNDPNAVPGTATHTGVNDTVYNEKKSWNPFKKHKTTTATTTVHNPDYPDNRVSYSSNAALNQ
ncbi:hypothetical protein EC968_001955 [Mortierella alpina]|nr:hypothetical protein EC968_001955 [Mortierella alpina]